MKMTPERKLLWILCGLLAGIALSMLLNCGKDQENTHFLPVVDEPTHSVVCRDLLGKDEDIVLPRRQAGHRDDVCFLHRDCFYNCDIRGRR